MTGFRSPFIAWMLAIALAIVLVLPVGGSRAQVTPPAPVLGPAAGAPQAAVPAAAGAAPQMGAAVAGGGFGWLKTLCERMAAGSGGSGRFADTSAMVSETGFYAHCEVDFGGNGDLEITAFDSDQTAADWFEGWQNQGEAAAPEYGDQQASVTYAEEMGAARTGIFFRTRCFTANARFSAANASLIRSLLSEAGATVRDKSCSPGAATTSTEATAAMTLGLACDANVLQSEGRLVCSAGLTNIPAGAQIEYGWALDRAERPFTGPDYEGVAVGPHTIQVIAKDTVSGVQVGPQLLDVTRYAPGQAPAGAGGFGGLRSPLVVGGAIAVTLALIGLVWQIRRPGKTAARPASAKSGTPPNSGTGPRSGTGPKNGASGGAASPGEAGSKTKPRARPPGPESAPTRPPGPEAPPARPAAAGSGDKDKRERDRPTIAVQMRLRPSVLCESLFGPGEPQILADGADLMFAGFDLEIGPPGQWVVHPGLPRHGAGASGGAVRPVWSVANGNSLPVEKYGKFGSEQDWAQAMRNGFTTPSDASNAIIRADWADDDGLLRVTVTVRVTVQSTDTLETAEVEATAVELVPIRGANRSVTLSLVTDRQRSAFGYESAGSDVVDAPCDGECRVRAEPLVELFGAPYVGGLRIFEPIERIFEAEPGPDAFDTLKLSEFFAPRREKPNPDARQQAIATETMTFRCKARLADQRGQRLPGNGCPIRVVVEPTGDAPGLDSNAGDWDFVLKRHYKACADHYKVKGYNEDAIYQRSLAGGDPAMLLSEPAWVRLEPALIKVLDPVPAELPRPGDSPDIYTSRLIAQVQMPSGDVVKLRHLNDLTASGVTGWEFRLWYYPPEEEWRRRVDKGRPQDKAVRIPADGFGKSALIEPEVVYRHRDHFLFEVPEREIDDPQGPSGAVSSGEDSDDVAGEAPEKTDWEYVGGQTCAVHVELHATFGDQEGVPVSIGGEAAKPIAIKAIDEEWVAVEFLVLALSDEPLKGARVAVSQAGGQRTEMRTDHEGRVTMKVQRNADNRLDIEVAYQTTPLFGPSVGPGEPWPSPTDVEPGDRAHGTTKRRKLPRVIKMHGVNLPTQPIIMPVSTKWAIQTDITVSVSFGVGAPTKVTAVFSASARLKKLFNMLPSASVGPTVITAYLINQATFGTGDLPGNFSQFRFETPADMDQYRRIAFGAVAGSLGYSPDGDVTGALEMSQPGATAFRTRFPVAFEDFHQQRAWMGGWEAAVAAGLPVAGKNLPRVPVTGFPPNHIAGGKGWSWIWFTTMTTRPGDIDVSSIVSGVGGQVSGKGGGTVSANAGQLSVQGGHGLWWLYDQNGEPEVITIPQGNPGADAAELARLDPGASSSI